SVEMNAEKAADQNGAAPVVIPISHEDSMNNALLGIADAAALPLARAVVHKRHMPAVVRRLSVRVRKGGIDQNLVPAAVDFSPTQTMRCGESVNLCGFPRFPWV